MPEIVTAYIFGKFRLTPARRQLLREDHEVLIRSRPFDLLLALVERRGQIVTKDELFELVWPGRVVEEGNLTVHISTLRRILGTEAIATVPGKGYRFVAEVREITGEPQAARGELRPAGNIARPLTRLIGREAAVDIVSRRLEEYRLVTIVGTGGIGKTRVSVEIAVATSGRYPGGIWLVDLTDNDKPEGLPAYIAEAMGIELAGDNPMNRLNAALADAVSLIILDSCEHLLQPVAMTVEGLLRACPGIRILATSREPLRAEGESIHRLGPLALSPVDDAITGQNIRSFAAADLFIERAAAGDDSFALTDHAAATIMAICRRLDGIPLAIELAAGRLNSLGFDNLLSRLDDRFDFLTGGRRTALPRHQTLAATIDWSFRLLSPAEARVLFRLSVFSGGFTVEAAEAVADCDDIEGGGDVIEHLSDLVAKSLVAVENGRYATRYRLLDTTKSYLSEKLVESGECAMISRRHAAFFLRLLTEAQGDWRRDAADEWLETYRAEIENIRLALNWAFDEGGDATLGISLASVAVGLMLELGLLETARKIAERALDELSTSDLPRLREEMVLQANLGVALLYSRGPVDETQVAWSRTLDIALILSDRLAEARASWGFWCHYLYRGQPRLAMGFADRHVALASDDHDVMSLISYRMVGVTQHFLGKQGAAHDNLSQVITNSGSETYRRQSTDLHIDLGIADVDVVGRTHLARVLWLQGKYRESLSTAERSLQDARSNGHLMTLNFVLTEAVIPLYLLAGDDAGAKRCTDMLFSEKGSAIPNIWQSSGRCFEAIVLMRAYGIEAGQYRFLAAFSDLRAANFFMQASLIQGMYAEILMEGGCEDQALASVDEALGRCDAYDDRWFRPELLRIKARIMAARGAVDDAQSALKAALDCAEQQGAATWQLRTTLQRARLQRDFALVEDWREPLLAILRKFADEQDTDDLQAAREMLARA
ncbi:MAG TPA: winged helix-turn-helix domain-containing protein [Terriglobia bacterium]|nr:winged helix-turn-helix domain-containing protein [Terriglobia bacterium]